jgi:hypothetical protein
MNGGNARCCGPSTSKHPMTVMAEEHSVVELPEGLLHSGTCRWMIEFAKVSSGSIAGLYPAESTTQLT